MTRIRAVEPMFQHTNHREREILETLRQHGGSCRIQWLAETLNVSEETIRRNVKTLASAGAVRKVHGGVHIIGGHVEQPFNTRFSENAFQKQAIADHVAKIICSGDTLFLDIGSTTAHIAAALQSHRDLFVVTNSMLVAQSLASRNNNRVFLAGGELRAHDGGAFGKEALEYVKQFNVQYAILSVAAINASAGFMLHDIAEAEFSREISSRARIRIVAADSAKFNKSGPIILSHPSDFDMLVSDRMPPPDICRMLADNEVDLVLTEDQRGQRHTNNKAG
uniref:DeoR/GlpR family DNA-binding transcription regulator n=1 Tax=Pararhizobium sp. IMCC3301 TaxID=3067904 RepID=UPI002741050B|nr:DeoR/GlpR family DNA-binding transcription regulator [Pararhizobium sp. IMCC3301]